MCINFIVFCAFVMLSVVIFIIFSVYHHIHHAHDIYQHHFRFHQRYFFCRFSHLDVYHRSCFINLIGFFPPSFSPSLTSSFSSTFIILIKFITSIPFIHFMVSITFIIFNIFFRGLLTFIFHCCGGISLERFHCPHWP